MYDEGPITKQRHHVVSLFLERWSDKLKILLLFYKPWIKVIDRKYVYRLIFLQRSSEYRDVNSRNINIVLIIQQRSSAACIFSFLEFIWCDCSFCTFFLNPYTRILSNLVAKKETKLSVNKVNLWINLAALIVQLNSDTAAASLSSHPAGISEKRCTFAHVKS